MKLPELRPSTYPTPADLITRRIAAGSAPVAPLAPGVTARQAVFGGVPCIACTPATTRGLMVYFHGGGFRLGSASRSAPFASQMARATQLTVVTVDYRLAPEHPFPAALQDAAAVYTALLADGQPVVAAGDSAGGGLAAALVVAASTSDVAPPAALVLVSPWLDLTCTASTFESRAGTDELFSLASAREAADMYLQGHEAPDPLASPLLATLDGWPPTLVLASADEVLLEDSVRFATARAMSGIPVTMHVHAGLPHVWPVVTPDHPASSDALSEIGSFVTGVLRNFD
ncbi:MAG: alpha/beta hydrolase fold domain-containing protein [Acidimicrobiaceae bacterium]|nr:alpha/beta hydrolase fold domain-containing protein [Acidimicrobiaceae bacterium]